MADGKSGSLWTSVPGMLTGLAALVTAIGGIYALRLEHAKEEECLIKGNISTTTGAKIYHSPGDIDYDKTSIDPAEGEQWFCTAAEAEKSGWRKAPR